MKGYFSAIFFLFFFHAHAQECDSLIWYYEVNRFAIDGDKLSADLLAKGFARDFFDQHTGDIFIRSSTDCPGSTPLNSKLAEKRSTYLKNCLSWYFNSDPTMQAAGMPEPGCTPAMERLYEPNKRHSVVRLCWRNNEINQPVEPVVIPAEEPIVQAPAPEPVPQPVAEEVQENAEVNELDKINELKVGETIVLGGLNFYPGKHITLPESKPILEKLLKIMQENPSLVIEIQGHVCCSPRPNSDGVDDQTGDKRLSWNRAEFVHDYLIEHGINKDRVSFKGYAMKRPLVFPERTQEDQKRNRRVEVMIISK